MNIYHPQPPPPLCGHHHHDHHYRGVIRLEVIFDSPQALRLNQRLSTRLDKLSKSPYHHLILDGNHMFEVITKFISSQNQ